MPSKGFAQADTILACELDEFRQIVMLQHAMNGVHELVECRSPSSMLMPAPITEPLVRRSNGRQRSMEC